jgi:hypothetical protein
MDSLLINMYGGSLLMGISIYANHYPTQPIVILTNDGIHTRVCAMNYDRL